jgi:hypothetical protein
MILAAAALAILAGPAFASSCPTQVKAIDAALAKKPQLTAQQAADVKKFRDQGEAEHKAGKHAESMATLAKAKAILKIQ